MPHSNTDKIIMNTITQVWADLQKIPLEVYGDDLDISLNTAQYKNDLAKIVDSTYSTNKMGILDSLEYAIEQTPDTDYSAMQDPDAFANGGSLDGSPGNISVSRNATANKAAWLRAWNDYGTSLGLRDKQAQAYLLGQLMHESGNFLYMEELASGAAYEGRKDLGNTQRGDGRRFKGRGPIQVTGRSNYTTIYHNFFVPQGLGKYNIVSNPGQASDPYIGSLLTMGWLLCTSNGKRCLEACNSHNLMAATRAVNGGTNGLADRKSKTIALVAKAKAGQPLLG